MVCSPCIATADTLSKGTLYVYYEKTAYHDKKKSWGDLNEFISYAHAEPLIKKREAYDAERKMKKIVEEFYKNKFEEIENYYKSKIQELNKKIEQFEVKYGVNDLVPQVLESKCVLKPLITTNKSCSCCGKTKPYSEYFKRSKGSKDGYNAKCKVCYYTRNV